VKFDSLKLTSKYAASFHRKSYLQHELFIIIIVITTSHYPIIIIIIIIIISVLKV
jgi:hypothetical protein